MGHFLLILLCLGLGIAFRISQRLPASAPRVLNGLVVDLALPAVILTQIHALPALRLSDHGLLLAVLMPWLVFGASVLVFRGAGSAFGWSRASVGALILTAGLGNTSFVGFPMLVAIYGSDSLRVAVFIDQLGTFLAMSTVGLLAAGYFSGRTATVGLALRKMAVFPPFVALVVALVLHSVPYPQWLSELLQPLSSSMTPLALVSVGYQLDLRPSAWRRRIGPLALGLGYKLALAPALVVLLYVGLFGLHGEAPRVTILEAAMAPMITGAVIADQYGLDPELANLALSIGIPLSLVTVPLWSWLIRGV